MKKIGKNNRSFTIRQGLVTNQIIRYIDNSTTLIIATSYDKVNYRLSTDNGTDRLNNLAKKIYDNSDFSERFPNFNYIKGK